MADTAAAAATTPAATTTSAGTADAGQTQQVADKTGTSLIGSGGEPEKKVEGEPEKKIEGEPEKKVEGEKKPEEKKPDEAAVLDVAKITLPEGFKRDDALFKEFSDVMGNKELAPQERGQKLVDLYTNAVQSAVKQVGDANTKAWDDVKTAWETEIRNDEKVGKDNLKPNLAKIDSVLKARLGEADAKAFKAALDVTGAGSNPAVYRGMVKLAELLGEGTHVPGNPGGGKQDVASMFFPNSPDMKGAS